MARLYAASGDGIALLYESGKASTACLRLRARRFDVPAFCSGRTATAVNLEWSEGENANYVIDGGLVKTM